MIPPINNNRRCEKEQQARRNIQPGVVGTRFLAYGCAVLFCGRGACDGWHGDLGLDVRGRGGVGCESCLRAGDEVGFEEGR